MFADALSWILLVSGGIFVFAGGLGALRMPDFYTRLHAASLTDSMGTILVLLGVALQAGWSLASVKLIAILIFLLLTSPAATYALGNAAHFAGLKPLTARHSDRLQAP
ncbi:MAG: monovalent cation/H(+) antiporter subunit G [Gammaproteobacteria bacterium]|nr:monovalent cation/H(+) antiporter subunit G [Gammaproteobacteria bacterium]